MGIRSIKHRNQPPSRYGAPVKHEEGDRKEEVPGSNPCGRGEEKDALYRWESMGGSFLNARGRTASADLSFFPSIRRVTSSSPCQKVERSLLKSALVLTTCKLEAYKRTGQNEHEVSQQA
eukprot:1144911-Pelagomonas_calceolata.AAC.1